MTMIQEPPEIEFSDDSPSPRSRRLRWAAGALVVVLAAGAGLGFVFSAHTAAPTHSRTTSSAAASPYALNNDPPPSLAGAYSDNPRTAFLALFAFHNWLYGHPSPAAIKRYTTDNSPAYRNELANVQYLLAHHTHFPKDPRGYDGDVEYVRVTQQPQQITKSGRPVLRDGRVAYGSAVVLVVQHELQAMIYGPTGVPLQVGQQPGYDADSYALDQGSDGQWRLYSAVVLNPPGGPQSLEVQG